MEIQRFPRIGVFGNEEPVTLSKVLPIDERRYGETKFDMPFSYQPTAKHRNFQENQLSYRPNQPDYNTSAVIGKDSRQMS
mgnify:CR=1 FL=1